MHPARGQGADPGSEHPGIAQMNVGGAVLPSKQAAVALGQTRYHLLRSTVLLAQRAPHPLAGRRRGRGTTVVADQLTGTPRATGASGPQVPIDRRRFLRTVGLGIGTLAVAGAAGVTWSTVSGGVFATGTGPAYAAWDQAVPAIGNPLGLVRAAVLAANAHNAQPWHFAVTPHRIDVFADPTRTLGTMDPLRREMHLSLGCAIENLVLAGPPNGLATTVTLMPDPADPGHVARVDLAPTSSGHGGVTAVRGHPEPAHRPLRLRHHPSRRPGPARRPACARRRARHRPRLAHRHRADERVRRPHGPRDRGDHRRPAAGRATTPPGTATPGSRSSPTRTASPSTPRAARR